MYELLENEIAAQLTPLKQAGLDVTALPEVEAEYSKPVERGKVTVAFKKSEYKEPKSTGHMVQDEVVHIELIIQAPKLRGGIGVYAIKKSVDKYVLGYKPSNFSKIWSTTFDYIDYTDGIFQYSYIVSCKTLVIEKGSDIDEPLLKEVCVSDITFDTE